MGHVTPELLSWLPIVLVVTLGNAAMWLPFLFVVRKAGYSGLWFLMILVPLGNIIAWWVFALADWPALKRREAD
jgi:hypothetical protein